LSAKRKTGTPRYPLRVDINPENWDWLCAFSKARDEGMGLSLDFILSNLRQHRDPRIPMNYRDSYMPVTIERLTLNRVESASYLGVSVGMIDKMVRDGLPVHKVGSNILFFPEDLENFVRQNPKSKPEGGVN